MPIFRPRKFTFFHSSYYAKGSSQLIWHRDTVCHIFSCWFFSKVCADVLELRPLPGPFWQARHQLEMISQWLARQWSHPILFNVIIILFYKHFLWDILQFVNVFKHFKHLWHYFKVYSSVKSVFYVVLVFMSFTKTTTTAQLPPVKTYNISHMQIIFGGDLVENQYQIA